MAKYNPHYIACDVETQGLEAAYDPDVPRLSIAFYSDTVSASLPWDEGLEYMQYLKDTYGPDLCWVFHNASFDVSVFRTSGVDIAPGSYHDTQVMSYVLRTDNGKYHGLDYLAQTFLGKSKEEKPDFSSLTEATDKLLSYNFQDAKLTYVLFQLLMNQLHDAPDDLYDFYYTIELPYVEVIIDMKKTGVYIDRDKLVELSKECHDLYLESYAKLTKYAPRMAESRTKIKSYKILPEPISYLYRKEYYPVSNHPALARAQFTSKRKDANIFTHCTYDPFNPSSPLDKEKVLTEMGCKLQYRKTTGKPVMDKLALEELGNPFADELVEYNKYQKLESAFFNTLLDLTEEEPQIFPSFNQCNVRTGRLSSSNPNAQQIPARGEWGNRMRSMFIAPEGYHFLVGDLDRIEICVLAFYLEMVVGYSGLADRVRAGEDVHEANRKAWSEVIGQELERKYCKNAIFARNYGCGDKKFAATLNYSPKVHVTVDDIKTLMAKDELMFACNELREVLVDQTIRGRGRLTTWMGRSLYIPEMISSREDRRIKGERLVFNYTIQGTSGDIFKELQINAHRHPKVQEWRAYNMLCQCLAVHDEAGYYVNYGISSEVREIFNEVYNDDTIMVYNGVSVPISCEFNLADNWCDAKGD